MDNTTLRASLVECRNTINRLISKIDVDEPSSVVPRLTDLILKTIEKAGPEGVTPSKIIVATYSFDRKTRDDVLFSLIDQGSVVSIKYQHKGAGRPMLRYVLKRFAEQEHVPTPITKQ